MHHLMHLPQCAAQTLSVVNCLPFLPFKPLYAIFLQKPCLFSGGSVKQKGCLHPRNFLLHTLDRGKTAHHVLVGTKWVGTACRLLSYNQLAEFVLWPRICAAPHSLKPHWTGGPASTGLPVARSAALWVTNSLRHNSPWSEPPRCTLWSNFAVPKQIPRFH